MGHATAISPDGKTIALTSDRGGADNLWLMDDDGSSPRQISRERFRSVNEPVWSADGRFVAGRKHRTTGRSLGMGEIWLYDIRGGSGLALIERPSPSHQKELGELSFSRDGRCLYYSRDASPGQVFEYARDSAVGAFQIERRDLASGETATVASGYGGGHASAAFARRQAPRLRQSGRWQDGAEGSGSRDWQGTYRRESRPGHAGKLGHRRRLPELAWTPDSASLVYWAQGKINRVASTGGPPQVIPFQIADERFVHKAVRPANSGGAARIRDQNRAVSRHRRRRRDRRFRATGPAVPAKAWYGLPPERASRPADIPRDLPGRTVGRLANGRTRVSAVGRKPHFAKEADRIYLVERADRGLALVSRDLHGGSRLVHATAALAGDMEIDPLGQWIMFEEHYRAHLAPLVPGLVPVELSADADTVPITRATAEWTAFPAFSPDGSELVWMQGKDLFRLPRASFGRSSPEAMAATSRADLGAGVPASRSRGRIALVGAKAITMAQGDGGLIEDAVVLVEDGRFTQTATRSSLPVPQRFDIIDLTGRVVIPGFIDAHAHGPMGEGGLIPLPPEQLAARARLRSRSYRSPAATFRREWRPFDFKDRAPNPNLACAGDRGGR